MVGGGEGMQEEEKEKEVGDAAEINEITEK